MAQKFGTHGRKKNSWETPGVPRMMTPEAQQYSRYRDRSQVYQMQIKNGHPVRNTLIVIFLVILVLGGAAGYTGYTLYNSAMKVKSEASEVMDGISDLKDQILDEKMDKANATAESIAKHSKNMVDETSGWEWTVASYVPVYGKDVSMVRELSEVMDDVSKNAIVPLVGEVSQISLKNLLDDGAINVDLAKRVVYALSSAAPVIERTTEKLDNMGEANLEQINGPLESAREKLQKVNEVTQFVAGIAPTFADMVGAGNARTYLIVAQTNAEIHSTGGFIGSIGALNMTDGKIELGSFHTIYDIYPTDGTPTAPLTEEELSIFGDHVVNVLGNTSWLPDWLRVGEIEAFAWEAKGLGHADGVIGVDPVFLQDMLSLVGGITLSNGVELNGDNTARYLLHDVYYLEKEQQDPLFEEAASKSFSKLMGNLGDISLTDFAKQVKHDIEERRIQVWMANPDEEEAIKILGCEGRMEDPNGLPVVNVYLNDMSYCKLYWYLKTESTVGDAIHNADGTTTYPVTVTIRNMISNPAEITGYMSAHNPVAYAPSDMITWTMVSAPLTCAIGNFNRSGSNFVDDVKEASLEGHDVWITTAHITAGDSIGFSFDLVLPAGMDEVPTVMFSPNAQDVAGW